ncbi:30S ribosomal protein S17 [Candidatus Pacearchaeota archaeon CG_4_9_14_3_um_filter_31_7]|nr:MAG: 30S ribosomal protein S17 [Candidatus Pacearchaeota archaeon CG1_02_31_27]PIN92368.1 MAG: 30S ribosomal protein S17 [Candidatus Pacearchaeota archaeon CG10_big_fil_rev_8_21_14_0_10_31_59]PIZ80670.1 MAG: 30S ribosomal protein S17 [Candidatus Pacearchaeota archaeon CG_4_10_14_0_2_um_filter_31_10]PJA70805.1 MAG: 30S ribosomal protein S17 [Candidatus Pacearchaeota archaeon CG_4_9_14_3_um_filter_31_7]
MKKEKKQEKNEEKISCTDKKCPAHGYAKPRGKSFKGFVIKKRMHHVTIDQERLVFNRKYERFEKRRGKIHAHLPSCMKEFVNEGDLIEVTECRPLSKIIHFVVTRKVK